MPEDTFDRRAHLIGFLLLLATIAVVILGMR